MDEYRVSPSCGISTGALQRLLGTPSGDKRLGPRDDDKVRVALSGLGRLDLAGVFVRGHQLTSHASVETTALGKNVVLDANPCHACPLVLGYGAHDVDRIAEAVVTISDDRNADGVTHAAHRVEGFTHSQDVGVGQRIHCRDAEAAGPDRVKARFFGELGRQRVVGTENQCRARTAEQFAELCSDWGGRHSGQTIRSGVWSRKPLTGQDLKSLSAASCPEEGANPSRDHQGAEVRLRSAGGRLLTRAARSLSVLSPLVSG